MKKMKILRCYKDELDIWTEVSEQECLQYTEGKNYWLPGVVLDMLRNGETVHTPYAEFKAV